MSASFKTQLKGGQSSREKPEFRARKRGLRSGLAWTESAKTVRECGERLAGWMEKMTKRSQEFPLRRAGQRHRNDRGWKKGIVIRVTGEDRQWRSNHLAKGFRLKKKGGS